MRFTFIFCCLQFSALKSACFGIFWNGECPNVKPVNATQGQIEGRWFVAAKSKGPALYDEKHSCRMMDFHIGNQQQDLKVMTTICSTSFLFRTTSCNQYQLLAYRASHFSPDLGSFVSIIPGEKSRTTKPDYFFLHLDDKFMVLYHCRSVHGAKLDVGFVLSRDQFAHRSEVNLVSKVFKHNGFELALYPVIQSNCPSRKESDSQEMEF